MAGRSGNLRSDHFVIVVSVGIMMWWITLLPFMYLTKNIIKEQIQLKKTFVASCFVFKPGVLHFHNTHLNGTISGKNSGPVS